MMRQVERFVMLETVDRQWKDHLYSLDHLKEGIGLRGYGQKDPLVEYKRESFELFQDMKRRVDEDMVNRLWIGQFTVVGDDAPQRPRAAAPPADDAERARMPSRWARSARRRVRRAAPAGLPGAQPVCPLGRRRPCRRRRRTGADRAPRRAEGGPQRSVPVRQRQEIQEMPWSSGLTWKHETHRQSSSWARST